VSSLSPDGEVRRTGDLDAALAVLATECIELFRGADRDLLSRCADPRCTRLFIDRSRGQRRRWCDMKGCGDRAKAGAYRQRRARTRVSDAT
jgi:predicted RNA-binding Zn ribbon-like protein